MDNFWHVMECITQALRCQENDYNYEFDNGGRKTFFSYHGDWILILYYSYSLTEPPLFFHTNLQTSRKSPHKIPKKRGEWGGGGLAARESSHAKHLYKGKTSPGFLIILILVKIKPADSLPPIKNSFKGVLLCTKSLLEWTLLLQSATAVGCMALLYR